MQLLLIGAGSWGTTWIDMIEQAPDWELAGLVDVDPSALARAGEMAGLPAELRFTDLADALSRVPADAALVAVPPALHARVASAVLEAGLHCLVEKPLAATLAEAIEMVRKADEAGRTLMVSQHYRYARGALALQRLVRDEAIGAIGAISIRFFRQAQAEGFRRELDEPLLLDMAVHHFDQLRGTIGFEPARVWATSSNPIWSGFRGNANAWAALESESGATAWYAGSWSGRGLETSWSGEWEIHGEGGAIVWDGEDRIALIPVQKQLRARVARRLGREWKGRRIALGPVVPPERVQVLAEFAGALREGREPETSGWDNLRSIAVAFAAITSARTHQPVEIELPKRR